MTQSYDFVGTGTVPSPDFYWLLLQRLGITATAVRRLADADTTFDTDAAGRWLGMRPAALGALGLPAPARERIAELQQQGCRHPACTQARHDLDWLTRERALLLHLAHPLYPALLREISDPPPWLYVLGNTDLLALPQLAVVGSRRPSRQGLEDAAAFAGELARAGFVITSGMAHGIDAAAHRAALKVGGHTIAVLGTGLDRVYPARHAELAGAIRETGLLVTEQPLGTPPAAGNFPRRNRIISGLSLGVLVVEAALRSGSLVTARLALEQNREVFALPGSIHNPAARGSNALIRQGATLVQEVADIGEELGGWREPAAALPAAFDLPDDDHPLLTAVGYEPAPLELIVERSGLQVSSVLAALAELELSGTVVQGPGGWSRLARRPRLR